MKNPIGPTTGQPDTSKDDSENEDKKLSIPETLEKLLPECRDPYRDRIEIQNYNQDGAAYYRMNDGEVLEKITKRALSEGLDPDLTMAFVKGSSIWSHLGRQKQKELISSLLPSGLYFPGPIHIVDALSAKYRFRTIPEIGTDKEQIYYFNGQIYERGEEVIKVEAHKEFLSQWRNMLDFSDDKSLNFRLNNALHTGPTTAQINEVLSMIRRTSVTQEGMNPDSHIPFQNGLLNLKTLKLEPFNSDLFYTFQINAKLLDKYVSMLDVPKFGYLLNTAFYTKDVPLVLSLFAYSLYPALPVHKTLFVLGRERIGKGSIASVLQGLMPKGSGSISLARLLTSERFTFTGIEGKNLLVDYETKRKFRRGTVLEWSAFCNLFSKDVLSVEPKGHEAHDYINKAKGIFLGNLPFILVDNPAAISRILLVVTKDERPKMVIPDLDTNILESESDQIATLLIQILFKLMDRGFIFPGQLTDDETAQLIEKLADPIENFIDEETEYDNESTVHRMVQKERHSNHIKTDLRYEIWTYTSQKEDWTTWKRRICLYERFTS